MGRGDLGGVGQVGGLVDLDSGDNILKMAGAASSSSAAALSLQGPLEVADTGRSTETARGASRLLVVERARSAASADTVGLNVLSASEARGTLRLFSGNNHIK